MRDKHCTCIPKHDSETGVWKLKQMTTSNSRCVSERVYVPYLAGLIPVLYRLDGVEKSALDA